MSCPRGRNGKHVFGSRHRHLIDGEWSPWIVSCSNCGRTLRPCPDCEPAQIIIEQLIAGQKDQRDTGSVTFD